MRPRARFLSEDFIQRCLLEARRLLQVEGIRLQHDGLLRRLADMGCRVDLTGRQVWFTQEIIDRSLQAAPAQVKLWNIAGTQFCDLSGDNVHFTPASAAIRFLDYRTNRMRRATTEDMLRYSRLVEQLDPIDYSSTAVVPSDVPERIGDSIRLYALLKTTTKPIVTGAFTIPGLAVMADLQLAVRRTRRALREKPFAIFSCCPTSPLRWSDVTADNVVRCAELGIPVEFISMPLAGLVAPVTLAGCVVQHAAETLSGIVISQTTCPGAPILYGGSPGIFDMRSMAATVSSVEAQMIGCACAEVGKHLRLPTQAYIGMSDSKALDAQAGFESGTGVYLAALAGINSVSGPGMLYFESCQSMEKLILDAEICGTARRLIAGLEGPDSFPAGELFEELLREGSLLASEHTLRHFRREHYLPGPTLDRTQVRDDTRRPPDLRRRAHAEVQRRLRQYRQPAVLSGDQLRDVQEVMTAAAGDFELTF